MKERRNEKKKKKEKKREEGKEKEEVMKFKNMKRIALTNNLKI